MRLILCAIALTALPEDACPNPLAITFAVTSWIVVSGQPYLYNPYHQLFRYSVPPYYSNLVYANHLQGYSNHLQGYSPFLPSFPHNPYPDHALASYLAQPYDLPTLNLMAEVPSLIKNKFTVVPMFAVAKENMNLVSNALIIQVSRQKPIITVKNEEDQLIQCTPAVKVVLEKPIILYSLKTSIVFPSEIEMVHGGFKIPIRVGAIIAPIPHDTYVSAETPVPVNVVYAVPTKPFVVDYVNNDKDVTVSVDTQAVIVENDNNKVNLPPKNVTVLEFPETEAEPTFQVDEEDDELVNRNPPAGVIPAGIVQSTQPLASIQPFHNSKESPILTALREEAAKNRAQANQVISVAPAF